MLDNKTIADAEAGAPGALQALLDAIPANVALIDASGYVLMVNKAWDKFATMNNGGQACRVGASYLDACANLPPEDGAVSCEANTRLREILAGTEDAATFVYPCHSPNKQRWFRAHFARLPKDGKFSAVVMHFDITESMLAEQKLFELVHFDSLTGLPNRVLFTDRLHQTVARASRYGSKAAVLFADLDRLKKINDTLGHQVGDALIQQVGQRLSDTLRRSDTVGRLGSDEFAFILSDVKEAEEVASVVRKLMNALRAPFLINGSDVFTSASIGIAIYPDDAEDPDILLRHADTAMYRAKEGGRDKFEYFVAAMNERAQERQQLDVDLRHALSRGEFVLFYQPKVSCHSGAIVGAEALIRWRHPQRGLVSPAEFIPILEELNLIDGVGSWVIDEACRQIGEWQATGWEVPAISVNLSAQQLDDEHLVKKVRDALERNGVRPDRFELELTESLLMRNVDRIIPTLAELRQLGVKLSVDDFGTGYSSLSYLKQFPLDAVKVDRSFVQDITADPDDASITRAVITMAHQLKLKVIAEGVETEGQLTLLIANQCDEIQGFFFSRPVPASELECMLREKRCLPAELIRPENRQRTILLVDDEENILASLRRLLRRDGYRILAATSAAEGLELLAKNSVDVIISDQRMPSMTGVEFLRRVKTIHPDTVRMVLSGYTELQSITDAINEGAIYKFLTKPWDDDQLRANIEEAFRHKGLADENRRLGQQLQMANTGLARTNQQLQELLSSEQQRIIRDETMLGVIQEVLRQVPIPIAGVDEEGMVVFANEEADRLLGGGASLLGNYAGEIIPAALLDLLARPVGSTQHWEAENTSYLACTRPIDDRQNARGTLLMLVPERSNRG